MESTRRADVVMQGKSSSNRRLCPPVVSVSQVSPKQKTTARVAGKKKTRGWRVVNYFWQGPLFLKIRFSGHIWLAAQIFLEPFSLTSAKP